MNIRLGNLSIEDIERRTGVRFPEELRDFMGNSRQEIATDIAEGKWHCFDLPFIIVCGDSKTAETIYKHLSPLSSQMKGLLQIGVKG